MAVGAVEDDEVATVYRIWFRGGFGGIVVAFWRCFSGGY